LSIKAPARDAVITSHIPAIPETAATRLRGSLAASVRNTMKKEVCIEDISEKPMSLIPQKDLIVLLIVFIVHSF
jgi:hypothetical protein